MSLLPSDEQRLLAEAAQTFLAARAGVAALRALRSAAPAGGAAPAEGHDPQLWREVADMGWPAAVLPEAHGGLDFGWQGLGGVFEAAGRHLSVMPLLSSVVLGAGALLESGDAAQQALWLPRVASGEARLALACDEAARHAPTRIATRAVRQGSGWRLDGLKTLVLDAAGAQAFVVVARTEGDEGDAAGLGFFLVEAGTPGLHCEALPMLDSRPACRLRLEGVELGPQALCGDPAGASVALERVLDRARVCLAAEGLGLVSEVFARTVGYLKERVQFDVPIGSFQALQHRAARLYAEIELLRSAVAAALEAIDAADPALPLLASLAKASASDLAERACNESVQLHGGIGVTEEFDIGLFLKRGRVLSQTFGDAAFHRDRYARLSGF